MSRGIPSKPRMVRDIVLLASEEPLFVLHPKIGLLSGLPPEEGDFLLLTDRRVMARSSEKGRESYAIALLEAVEATEIISHARNSIALVTGALLALAGMASGVLAYSLGAHTLIALVLAVVIAGLGLLNLSRYLFPDEAAAVVFRTAASEVKFPLYTKRSTQDALSLVGHIFQLKVGEHPDREVGNSLPQANSPDRAFELAEAEAVSDDSDAKRSSSE